MTPKSRLRFLLPIIMIILVPFLNACGGDSGYGMAPPYVISGTVTVGDDQTIAGTVYVKTYKRADVYDGVIDADDGSYRISVTKHDPPYLVWANLNGQRTLYSYTAGSRNPTQEEIDAEKADAEETGEDPAPVILEQTVNITPLTDLLVSLAYLKDTQTHFADNPYTGFPSSSKLDKFNKFLDDIFEDTFDYLNILLSQGSEDPVVIFTDYDFLHGNLESGDFMDQILGILSVTYPVATEPDETRKAILTLKDGIGSGDEIFFAYDLIEDETLSEMDTGDALDIIQLILGI
jgi:hypothetical protein